MPGEGWGDVDELILDEGRRKKGVSASGITSFVDILSLERQKRISYHMKRSKSLLPRSNTINTNSSSGGTSMRDETDGLAGLRPGNLHALFRGSSSNPYLSQQSESMGSKGSMKVRPRPSQGPKNCSTFDSWHRLLLSRDEVFCRVL